MKPEFREKWEKVIPLLENSDKIFVFTHVNVDGDALGSSSAFCLALRELGLDAHMFIDAMPCYDISYMLPEGDYVHVGPEASEIFSERTCGISVDASAKTRIAPGLFALYEKLPVKIKFDHHEMSEGWDFADFDFTDPHWSAACQGITAFITELYERAGKPLSYEVAVRLYSGIVTDTGGFSNSGTTPEAMVTAAELLKIIDRDVTWIFRRNFDDRPEPVARLLGEVFSGMEAYNEGKILLYAAPQEVFEKTGTSAAEFGVAVAEINKTLGCKIAVTLRYDPVDGSGITEGSGAVKVSMRSVKGISAEKICKEFGGGGHECAAGATVMGTLESVKKTVLEKAFEACGL